jgi:hypothetical protein
MFLFMLDIILSNNHTMIYMNTFVLDKLHANEQGPVRLAYQPPTSNTFLSEQTSHQQSASSTLLSEQTSTSHQPQKNSDM